VLRSRPWCWPVKAAARDARQCGMAQLINGPKPIREPNGYKQTHWERRKLAGESMTDVPSELTRPGD
jgi:hypothetical protein